jgi:two-component system LytT family response regulator
MLRNTMANFETKLEPEVFLRIHRSAIVNLQHTKEFRTDGNDGECFVTMRCAPLCHPDRSEA